jgi:protein TonB
MEGLYKNISYPDVAKKAGVSGKVYLLAFINERGDVDNVKVIKGIGGGCDEAAVKVLDPQNSIPQKIKAKQ